MAKGLTLFSALALLSAAHMSHGQSERERRRKGSGWSDTLAAFG